MATKYKSISAAKKAGSIYYYDKNGTKQLAVTKETLDAWKKKNKGKYKGNSLTAWANNKGKNVGAPKKKEEIQVRKLSPSTVGKGRGDGEMELFQRKVDKKRALPGGSAVTPRVGTAQDNNPNKNLAGAGTVAKDPRGATRDDGPNVAPNRTGSNDKTSNKNNPRSKTRFPEGNVSSSRSGAKQGMIRAGDEENALDALAVKRAREKRMNMNKGGMTKGYNEGGLRMVKKGDEEVPFFAADGKGKMNKGGMTKKSGYMGGGMTKKKVMTYNMGGMVKSQTNNLKKGRS